MRRRQATPSGVWRRGQLHSQGRNRERYLELGLYASRRPGPNAIGAAARGPERQDYAIDQSPGGPHAARSGNSLSALYFSSANSQLRQVRAETDQEVALEPEALVEDLVALRAVSRNRAELG